MSGIRTYILLAIAKLRAEGRTPISFAELFCADAFYAVFARKWGADSAIGIDSDRDGHLKSAALARKRCGVPDVGLLQADVMALSEESQYSIVANIGGLYHVADPLAVLRHSWILCSGYLVVQSVVTLATNDPGYFEAPAPGWDWGCRFSRAWFERALEAEGYDVVDTMFNELTGNDRPEDRGSVYCLIRKA